MCLKRANAGLRAYTLAALVLSTTAFAVSMTALTTAPAFALPEGRVYEMVSPVYKGGYGADPRAVAPDGESVAFVSPGVFADEPWTTKVENYYIARRGSDGWETTALSPPPVGEVFEFSADLGYALGYENGVSHAGAPELEGSFVLHPMGTSDESANWEVFGGLKMKGRTEVLGASADLCHVVIQGPRDLLPETANTPAQQYYDLSRGCDGPPSLSLVGAKNDLGVNEEPEVLDRTCNTELGIGSSYDGDLSKRQQASGFNAIAAGGEEIFFTTNVEAGSHVECDAGAHQLFARLGGSHTIEVSRPLSGGSCEEVPCVGAAKRASAYFKGASEDGSRVFFTTTAPLTGDVQDTSSNLYMAVIGCPEGDEQCAQAQKEVTSLVQVSHDPVPGQDAEVQGVVSMGQSGGYVYFVAQGVLSQGANTEGDVPALGAENLYAYDTATGGLAFVADLCSGSALSGAVPDARCPADLEQEGDDSLWRDSGEAQSTANGEFLVFSSFGQLVKGDTDTAKDVYRYDAVTGELDRVSLGEDGAESNGNQNGYDATIPQVGIGTQNSDTVIEQQEMDTRAISEDGSRIVFSSAGPLSPRVTNHTENIYEWHKEPGWAEGRVSLISSGSAPVEDFRPVITPSGRDIFFATFQGLVPQDTGGEADIYDARLGGGFPERAAGVQECSGDACQGALSAPAPLLVPGSVSQAPGENLAAPVVSPAPAPKRATPKCQKGKRLSRGKCIKENLKKRKSSAKKSDRRAHR